MTVLLQIIFALLILFLILLSLAVDTLALGRTLDCIDSGRYMAAVGYAIVCVVATIILCALFLTMF